MYTYFRHWHKDGTWLKIHDHLREWVRIEQAPQPSPSEASIDSQRVKSAAIDPETVLDRDLETLRSEYGIRNAGAWD